LKAICEHFRTPQFGHNLNLLLQAVAEHIAITEPLRMACARLNRYYIPTRYPDAFAQGAPADQFFEADARQALTDAEEVMSFAEDIIRSS
jgi:HEPN domain-containing protein